MEFFDTVGPSIQFRHCGTKYFFRRCGYEPRRQLVYSILVRWNERLLIIRTPMKRMSIN